MKRKIATLIMLIILFIISVTTLIMLGLGSFSKPTEEIEYPIWLDESFYKGKENPLEDNVTSYYNEHGATISEMNDVESFSDVSLLAGWVDSGYITLNVYEEILTQPEEGTTELVDTAIINNDAINLGNVTNINNSVVIAPTELSIGTEESKDETLTISSSIIFSLDHGMLYSQLSNYNNVEIDSSIIFTVDHNPGFDDWSNINITNSIISGTANAEEGLQGVIMNEEDHLLNEYYGMTGEAVYYDNWFERIESTLPM